jgi:hypothetical protein
MTVTSPKTGDTLYVASTFFIQWTSNTTSKVKIEFSTDIGVTWILIADNITNSGSYDWDPIPNLITNLGKVRISTDDSLASNVSTGIFSIVKAGITVTSPQSITVLSPNGGENWLVNTTNEIRWTSIKVDTVNIDYSINGGASWNTVVDGVPSNGLYNWKLPVTEFRSDLCLIKISDSKQGTPSDISDGYFSIHPNTKLLRWVFPNGGEFIWQDTLVTWVSTGIASVNIEYTDDNGNTWHQVANNYHSTGAYLWHLPFSLPSTLARLRIFDSSDSTISDMSDSYFNLHIEEGIGILSTGGNGIYPAGSDMKITWKASNNIPSVNIEYSADNGRSWNLIADNVPSTYLKDNNFIWRNIPQVKGNILIRLTDTEGKYSAKSSTLKIN